MQINMTHINIHIYTVVNRSIQKQFKINHMSIQINRSRRNKKDITVVTSGRTEEGLTCLYVCLGGLYFSGLSWQHGDLRPCLLDELLEVDLPQLFGQLLQLLLLVLVGKYQLFCKVLCGWGCLAAAGVGGAEGWGLLSGLI